MRQQPPSRYNRQRLRNRPPQLDRHPNRAPRHRLRRRHLHPLHRSAPRLPLQSAASDLRDANLPPERNERQRGVDLPRHAKTRELEAGVQDPRGTGRRAPAASRAEPR